MPENGYSVRAVTFLFLFICGVAVAGCASDGIGTAPLVGDERPPTSTVQTPLDIKYFPSDQSLKLGQEYFHQGAFGIAAKYFENAVTKAPEDVTAWIGLAASYDRIGRFDLADRAYEQAIKLGGETTTVLNNEGYSYMLRGRLDKARSKLMAAYQRDPHDPTIINNLRLLNSSQKFIQRND